MIGHMKHILSVEQKKTDFKPEDENNVLIQYTNVCTYTTAHFWEHIAAIHVWKLLHL